MRDIGGQVAVVTGAASGIGLATARALAERGCHVALADIDAAGLERAAVQVQPTGVDVSTHVVDVADKARMRALPADVVDAHGRVSILVNNAGVGVSAPFDEQSLEDFEWLMGINFWGVVYGCKFFLPHLKREPEAHIVNLSSLFGIVGIPGQSSYNSAKFAVRGFSESLYAELAADGIGVTSVHPGGVRTAIVQSSRVSDEGARARTQEFFDRRAVPPERVARAIVRGIERNRLRVLVCPETFVLDWLKRLFPTLPHRLLARAHARGGLPT